MKKLILLLFILSLFVFLPLDTHANDPYEGAIDLQRNNSTDFSIPEKSDLTSILGDTDRKIYKVALGMNKSEKLTLVTRKTVDIEITDPKGDRIV